MCRLAAVLWASLLAGAPLAAQQDRPVLRLDVTPRGEVLVPGRKEPLRTPKEVETFLAAEYRKARPDPTKELRTAVLLRVHLEAAHADVRRLLEQCRAAGFRRLQLGPTEK